MMSILFILPSAAAVGAGVLFHSKGPETTVSRGRDYAGLVVLLLVVLWQGFYASEMAGAFALFGAPPALITSLAIGLWLVFDSRKWRKLLGGIVGVAYPVMLISVTVVGSASVPPQLTVGESALRTTKELLGSVNKAPYDGPSYLWVDEGCWLFLRQALAENSGQYTLTLVSEYDSANDPHAVHDYSEATVLVDFPDRRQAKIWFFNGGAGTCTYPKP